jgi:hypothetical protein
MLKAFTAPPPDVVVATVDTGVVPEMTTRDGKYAVPKVDWHPRVDCQGQAACGSVLHA